MTSEARWVESMPEIYDRALGPALFAPFAERLARMAAELAPLRVLELAAGTGIATAALADALPGAVIVATDLNPGMVARGRARVPGVTWQVADAQHLEAADGSVDLAVCQFGVMFFPDRPAAFAEIARVLAPGGTLLFAVWDRAEHSHFSAALVESLAAVLPQDPPTFIVRVPHGYHDPARIEEDLRAGGLAAIDIEHVVLPGVAGSADQLAEGYCLGTPLRFALEERGPLEELTGAVSARMTARLGAGPVSGDLAAYVVTARRSL